VARILDSCGQIDVLVNAAGTNVPHRNLPELTSDAWIDVHSTNLHGPFFCINAVLPQMRLRRQGLIINIGSWGGRFALRLTGAAYAASKRGLIALTEALNIEEGPNGIRASVILPAAVNTPFLRLRNKS
jgi:NAD(P)-dependent dehydrogenase (short-subunit alcohol dehydrogenase family)